MISGDLDTELAQRLPGVAAQLGLSAHVVAIQPGSWRPVPAEPASYATALPLRIARDTARSAPEVASALAAVLSEVSWVVAARPSGAGFLTVTVTAQTLAQVASRVVASGQGCARSDLMSAASVVVAPWPDLTAAASWHAAWRAQAGAMTARFAEAAGAAATYRQPRGRSAASPPPSRPAASELATATEYHGVDAVRYMLARTFPGRASQLAELAHQTQRVPGPYEAVRLANAEAASVLRWAADLGLAGPHPADGLALRLTGPAERHLLGQLSWLPARVASAARRQRPAEIPRFLEEIAGAWTVVRLVSPALPFGGAAAATDPVVLGARLLLAEAVRTVLATGLALTGISPESRI